MQDLKRLQDEFELLIFFMTNFDFFPFCSFKTDLAMCVYAFFINLKSKIKNPTEVMKCSYESKI